MAVILTKKGDQIFIDDCDYELVSKYTWCLSYGYAVTTIKHNGKKLQLMHRMIIGVTDRWTLVDHINGNKLDNTRSNLRLCNASENARNRGATKNNTTGIKGLYYDKSNNGWVPHIKLNNKHHTKYFSCKKHGEKLAKDLAIQWLENNRENLHGEFARS